jgi:hypothetical protein
MTTSTLTNSKLARSILTARTPADVKALLAEAAKLGISDARAVGDREMNAATIEIASSPYAALGERVTNGLDAVIERLAQKAGYFEIADWPTPPTSPRDAAQTLFGLPKGGIADLTATERRQLAENVVVMLEESSTKEHPTVIIEDRGIGQHPTEMPDGLLSLNRDNKLRKPWQHGAYGQGGSATLRFAEYSLFISRKDPQLLDPGEPDVIGWSVAYKDEGDPYQEALPVYRYLVDAAGDIPTFDPALLPDPDWFGTRIIHVAYDLTRYSQAYTQLTNGIWGMFHASLFDPVLPFLIGGRRQVDLDAAKKGAVADDDMSDLVIAKGDSTRVVIGNRLRLEIGPRGKDPEIAWRGSDERDLTKAHGRDLGRLRINYWVVRRPVDSQRKTDPTLAYVTADSAVTITLNGQRHEAERRSWLNEKLGLPYLAKNLVVQIDIDELSPPARRELFSSTREQMVEGPMKNLVYSEAVAALNADRELRRLEGEMRDRAMSKGAEQIGDKVRDKLAKFVNTFLKGKTKKIKVDDPNQVVDAPPPKPPGVKAPPRSTDDQHLPNAPTDMKFERDPITITQGKRTTVWLHLDAKNGYLRRHEDDLKISFSPELGGKVLDVGKSELLAGKSMWTLQAEPDAPLGEGEIEAVLITPNGMLRASSKIRVIAPPKVTKRKQREKEVPVKGPNIVWVTREEWDADFNEHTVGEVNIGTDNTDIRVNRHHPLLDRALGDKSLTAEQVKGRGDRYLFAIGCGLFRQEYAMRDGGRPDAKQIQAEQERMAEAVLIAIDDKTIELED